MQHKSTNNYFVNDFKIICIQNGNCTNNTKGNIVNLNYKTLIFFSYSIKNELMKSIFIKMGINQDVGINIDDPWLALKHYYHKQLIKI